MGGQSTEGPVEIVQKRGYLGQGVPGHGVWSSVPFDMPLPQRQQLAAQESKQYDPKQYATDVEAWVKARQADPKLDVSNPPFPTDSTKRKDVLQKGRQIIKTLRGKYDT